MQVSIIYILSILAFIMSLLLKSDEYGKIISAMCWIGGAIIYSLGVLAAKIDANKKK